MSEAPLVSIVLCTFNGGQYIVEQLASLKKQTYSNIEIIISDNGSTDNTVALIEKWCAEDPRFVFYQNPEKGLNKNFFTALKKATGKYILFCDQDDIWFADKVEKLVSFHETHPAASMVYCLSQPFTNIPPKTVAPLSNFSYLQGSDIRKTLLKCYTLGHNMCLLKSIVEKIPVPIDETIAYDWWITVSAMCLGEVKCLPITLTFWRQHENNTTKDLIKGLFYENVLKQLPAFLSNTLIADKDRIWINKAIAAFKTQEQTSKFSLPLFLFLVANAPILFFYKTKKNPIAKWISFIKWAVKMSKKGYRS